MTGLVHICINNEAKRLANRFNIDNASSMIAGYLHDVGRIFPDNQSIDIASELGIQALDEEHTYAGLLHQKISKVLAYELFGINDNNILNAIECHTTLKAGASDIDLILFIADKLSWDSLDSKPILDGILKGLEKSLEQGAFFS
ncbi:MAG: bis(5'-nucleosyl)-tetraphosphatase (symmetrical) YqeK [Ruminiclostridium sp.]